MSAPKTNYNATDWGMLIGLSLMWGFSFFFIKKGLEAFSPYEVGAMRIFIAFATLLPLLPFYWKKIPLKLLGYILLAGIMGSGLPPFLFAIAETQVSSSVAGILNATTPLFALIFGVLFFGLKVSKTKFAGVLMGFAGVILIISSRLEGDVKFNPLYALLVVAATACYGLSANILKAKVLSHSLTNPIQVSVTGFALLGPFAGFYLIKQGVFQQLITDPIAQNSLIYLLILGIFGTGIAVLFFNTLTQRTSALFASFTTYLIPVVAIFVGLATNEPLVWMQLAGFAVIIAGVLLSNRG